MPKRQLDVNEIISNIFDYFTKERNNGGPLKSLLAIHQRICEATGISETKLKTVIKQKDEPQTQVKENHYSQPHTKSLDLSEGVKFEIRNLIYELRQSKQHVTLNSILTEINRKEITDIGRTSLHKILKSIGFKYKIENNRKALCENSAVVNKRISFLRKYQQLKCDGYFQREV